MNTFTDDENSYIDATLKSVKKSFRIIGGGIIAAAALAGRPLFDQLRAFEGFPGTGATINIILTSLFFLSGLGFFMSSFFEETHREKKTLTGLFILKYHRAKHICKIGDRRVYIPSVWQDWFRRGEEYTVEVFTCRIGLIRPAPLVLTVQGLPESLASIPLMKIKTSEKWLLSQAYRTFFKYSFFMILPFLGIYGIVSYFSKNPEGLEKVLVRHSDSIFVFFSYLEGHEFLLHLFSFFFRYGFIFFVAALILVVSLIKRRVPAQSRSHTPSFHGEERDVQWSRWISDYAVFLETKLVPVMGPDVGKDPALLIEYKDVMTRYAVLQREYKDYKKNLRGTDRKAFLEEFRRVNKTCRK